MSIGCIPSCNSSFNKVKPITPDEVAKRKETSFPPEVIEAFNTLIVKNYSNNKSIIYQNEVIVEIIANFRRNDVEVTREMIFKNMWLDVEPFFMNAGWNVEYDKPAYNEEYEANYTFEPKF